MERRSKERVGLGVNTAVGPSSKGAVLQDRMILPIPSISGWKGDSLLMPEAAVTRSSAVAQGIVAEASGGKMLVMG